MSERNTLVRSLHDLGATALAATEHHHLLTAAR